MIDLLKKVMYAGVGALALTEEKAKELVSELEKKGEVTSEEGKKMVKDLVEKGKQRSEELRKTVSEEVKKAIAGCNLVDKESFEQLKAEVINLSAKVEQLADACKKNG